ncbi:hypothetical protein MOC97_05120 [Bacillus atrophaeus]|uniref:hypothetical protein n=1 Tax=Bacillus atrophaeus TaxID=1452 RepID=UPI002281DBF0|nr:hypothetical protein [Bacillus atrophaeus]MCY8484872.1 hypothetical protein [Bacillus atrophaeus]
MMTLDEIKDFISITIKDKVSEYTGINSLEVREYSIEGSDQKGFSFHYKNSYQLPQENLEPLNLINDLVELIVFYERKYNKVDPSLIDNLFNDLSLSLIFENYNIFNGEHRKYDLLIKDLKNIGAKSYEGKAVDIGVIYCPNIDAFNQLKGLDFDYISLPIKKTIKSFFDEDKPFLRLIDNASLAIVIDDHFNVTGLLRKKKSQKSINYVIEKKFNTHVINKTYNLLLDIYLEKVKEILEGIGRGKTVIEEIDVLNKEMKRDVNNCPGYFYFSIKDSKINVFTENEFVLTYSNGDWKVKPYYLINAIVANYLFEIHANHFIFNKEIAYFLFNDLMDSIEVLSETLIRLSSCSTSSIFIIKNDASKDSNRSDLQPLYLNALSSKDNFNIIDSDYYLIESLSSVDGALTFDSNLNIVSFGEIINMSEAPEYPEIFGTGTKAARYASKDCLSIKISEDGDIYLFKNEEQLIKI